MTRASYDPVAFFHDCGKRRTPKRCGLAGKGESQGIDLGSLGSKATSKSTMGDFKAIDQYESALTTSPPLRVESCWRTPIVAPTEIV